MEGLVFQDEPRFRRVHNVPHDGASMSKNSTRIILALCVLFFVIVAIGVWNHFSGRLQVWRTGACISGLLQIYVAKAQCAQENALARGTSVTPEALLEYFPKRPMYTARFLTNGLCPDGGVYTINVIGEYPRCSIPGHAIDRADRVLPQMPDDRRPSAESTPTVY